MDTLKPRMKVYCDTEAVYVERQPHGLICAAKAGNAGRIADILRTLEPQKVDVRTADETEKRTALHWAADRGHLEAVVVLLAGGADVNACCCSLPQTRHFSWQARDPQVVGDTPLLLASLRGHSDVVAAVLEHGAKWALRDAWGCSAYDVAAKTWGSDSPSAMQLAASSR